MRRSPRSDGTTVATLGFGIAVPLLYYGVQLVAAPFFPDLPARMAAAHLIVSRAGASTIAELAAIGRPSILVQLPHALDQDQLANARVLVKAGGAVAIEQNGFRPGWLAGEIIRLAGAPEKLVAMGEAARAVGVIDAADRLAELVARTAKAQKAQD